MDNFFEQGRQFDRMPLCSSTGFSRRSGTMSRSSHSSTRRPSRGWRTTWAEACPDVVRRVFGIGSLADEAASARQLAIATRPARVIGRGRKSWSSRSSRMGQGTPWFMVHPPGGIVVCYQALARRLGCERPFYGIRSRGLHGEPDLPGRLEDMAAEYAAAVRRSSRAGLICSAAGLRVDWWRSRSPSSFKRRASRSSCLPCWIRSPRRPTIPNWVDRPGIEYGLDLSLEQLSRLGPDEQLPYLWQHALKLGLIESSVPIDVVHQVIDDLKRVFHHHMMLIDRYVVRRYSGRITLLRPSDAPVATSPQRDRGWGSIAAGVDVHFVPGQHHSMVQEPHALALAQTLAACLRHAEESQTESPGSAA